MTRLTLLAALVFAQPPAEPRPLPPGVGPTPPQQPQPPEQAEPPFPQPDDSVRLPRPEGRRRLDYQTAYVRRLNDSWQLWAGTTLLKDFGNDQAAAEEAFRAVRGLRPTEWAVIGTTRPVVEYGLTEGKPAAGVPNAKRYLPLDLKSVRAENVRGAWVLRDDENILLNFGGSRQDAEQAAAVAKRYGFNRVGLVGGPAPAMAYFYAAPVVAAPKVPGGAAIALAAQEQALTRTGVPVPGVGFVGERVVIEPRKVEVRKDRGQYVLAHGPDILARFGQSEWAARDAQKVVQECHFTEVCTVGPVMFFLVNGAPPTRVPFSVQGTRFDPKSVKARPTDGRWGVFEGGGRMLYATATAEEAEQVVKVIQAFQFDQLCQVGLSPRASLKFLAKAGR